MENTEKKIEKKSTKKNKKILILDIIVIFLLFLLESLNIIPQYIGFILLGIYFFILRKKKLFSFKNIIVYFIFVGLIVIVPVIYVKEGMSRCYPVYRESTFITIYELIRYGYNYPEECKPIPEGLALKPVIYLYPQKKQKIKVELDYKGKIIADYPKYDEKIRGWEVEAYPDGKVINLKDGKEYSYLFWEGMPREKINWDLSSGFVVEGKNAREFLREKLEYLGLTPKEYNEFIVYWYPKMMKNKYNLIHFATKKYTKNAPLKITPNPDSILRVFMLMKKLDKKIDIPEQKLKHFERRGFSVIEWGGSELK